MDFKDYYKTLGVPRTATGQEIKKAYRKLARQYHPDANPGDNTAEDRIKEINEAYEVLSDEDKRSKYDKFGAQWQQYQRAGGAPDDFWQQWSAQPGARSTTRTVSPEEFEQMFGGRGGFSDFFESLFGGMRQPGGEPFADIGARASAQRRDIEQPLEISLEDAFRGTTVSLQKDGRRLEIKVPRGVKTGSRVRVAGEGAPASGNTPAGDLYLVITVLPHPAFERDGDDLRVKLPVDLYTLLLGGEVQAPTLERPVLLTIPPETPNGKVFRLRGLGMPQLRTPDQRGDLYATVEVQLPRGLSEDERELFRQLRARSRAI